MCLSLLSFSLRWRETDWSCCISPSQQPPLPAAASTWSCRSCKWLQMVPSQPQEPTLPQVLVLGWSACVPPGAHFSEGRELSLHQQGHLLWVIPWYPLDITHLLHFLLLLLITQMGGPQHFHAQCHPARQEEPLGVVVVLHSHSLQLSEMALAA